MAKAKYVAAKKVAADKPDNALAAAVTDATRVRNKVDPSTVARATSIKGITGPAYSDFVADPDEKKITVVVPKAFTLTDDGHTSFPYPKGEYEMPISHARHNYSVLNGVTEV